MTFEKILQAEARKLFAPYEQRFSELDQPGKFPDVIDTEVLIDSPQVELYRGTLKIPHLILRKGDPALIVLGDLDVAELLEIHPQAGAVSVLGHIHAGSILGRTVPDITFHTIGSGPRGRRPNVKCDVRTFPRDQLGPGKIIFDDEASFNSEGPRMIRQIYSGSGVRPAGQAGLRF